MTPITPEEIETLRELANDSGDWSWCKWSNALADKIEAMQAENAALKAENAELQKQLDILAIDTIIRPEGM